MKTYIVITDGIKATVVAERFEQSNSNTELRFIIKDELVAHFTHYTAFIKVGETTPEQDKVAQPDQTVVFEVMEATSASATRSV